jgi:phosphoribosylglycinamide formyltransferase-1
VIPRWAIFVSGRGSNLQSVLDIQGTHADVVLVISNRPDAPALLKAKRQGVATLKLENKFSWIDLIETLKERKITHVFLLGFMKLVPASMCDAFKGRIFNLHPSLLPEFPGLQAIEKSFAAGLEMGVSVHHVTPEMDAGAVISQIKVTNQASQFSLEQAQFLIAKAERRVLQAVFQRVHCSRSFV